MSTRITPDLSDQTIRLELGLRAEAARISAGLSQEALARGAGISKRTLERFEAGESVQLQTFVRILRLLGAAGNLETILPQPGPSPMELLAMRGKRRLRAPRSISPKPPSPGAETRWGDES